MGTVTPVRGLYKPAHAEINWDALVDGNFDNLDATADVAYVDAQNALDEKLANKNVANGYAGLDASGLIDLAQLPPGTGGNQPYIVASEAEMLALPAHVGDTAIRTDINANFILGDLPPSVLANWFELEAPAGGVSSVAGKTGDVILVEGDIVNLTSDLAALVPQTTTVNGHALSSNITIAANDLGVGALPNGTTATTQLALDSSTKLSTTAYSDAAVAVEKTRALAAEALLVPKTTTVNGHALSSNVTITASDLGLSALATSGAWSDLQNATAALTLSNGANDSTFNHTSAVNWTLANTTAAVLATAQSSPILNLNGKYWDGAASQTDSWTLQNVVGSGTNGTSSLTIGHTGSTGQTQLITPGRIRMVGTTGPTITGSGTQTIDICTNLTASSNIDLAINLDSDNNGTLFNSGILQALHAGGLSLRCNNNLGTTLQQITISGCVSNVASGAAVQLGHDNGNNRNLLSTTGETSGVRIGTGTSGSAIGEVAIAPLFGNAQLNALSIAPVVNVPTATVTFTSATINSSTQAVLLCASTTGLTVGATGFVVAGFVNANNLQLNGSWTIAAVVVNTSVTLTGSGWTTHVASGGETATGTQHALCTYTGIKLNVTETAVGAATGNFLLDLQVGSVSRFSVDNTGSPRYANPTAATSGVPQSSPTETFSGQYWTGSASAEDKWTIQNVIASGTNGTGKLALTHTGTTGALTFALPSGATVDAVNWQLKTNPIGNLFGNAQGFVVQASGHAVHVIGFQQLFGAGVLLGNQANFTNPVQSGIGVQYGVALGNPINYTTLGTLNFAPTTSPVKVVGAGVNMIVNETGTASGDYTGLQVNVLETAFLGSNARLAEFQNSCGITNVSEDVSSVVTLTVVNNKAVAGQTVLLEGLTTATWLNGRSVVLTTASATTLTFTDPTAHGTQASHAEVGRVSLTVMSVDSVGKLRCATAIPTTITDGAASVGSSGNLLSSTGTGLAWVAAPATPPPSGTMHSLIFNGSATLGAGNNYPSMWSHLGGTFAVNNSAVSAGNPPSYISTSASAGSSTLAEDAIAVQACKNIIAQFTFYGALNTVTNGTFWFGFSALEAAALGVTNPNGSTIAFRFVQGTDTNFMAYVGTATGTFTATSTGVAQDTAWHEFKIAQDASGNFLFYIDGVLKVTMAAASTGMPTANTGMFAITQCTASSGTVSYLLNSVRWWSKF
jgi:hypothetical protein